MPSENTAPEKEPNLDVSAQLTENGKGLCIRINLADSSVQSFTKGEAEISLHSRFTVNGLFIRKGSRFIKINYEDILYLEASGSYTLVYTHDKQHTLTRNLTKTSEGLSYPPFMRVHRSFTVNLMNIDSFSDTLIYFGKKEVPVSLPYRKKLLAHLSCI